MKCESTQQGPFVSEVPNPPFREHRIRVCQGRARRIRASTAATECSRCLDPAEIPIVLTVEELYIPIIDPSTGARCQLREGEEDAYRVSERHIIDLTLPVQQYWSMALPIAPVCRPDCGGLCPECGERRDPDHGCAPASTDDRWAKLRDLKLSS